MYSPKISEDFIPALYHIAKAQQRPMTQLVNEILSKYLAGPGKEISNVSDNRQTYETGCRRVHRT